MRRLAACVGRPVEGAGVLVTCGPSGLPVRGVSVQLSGSAWERGLVSWTAVRARPWSARLAPWEAAGWESPLHDADAGGLAGWLPSVDARASEARAGPRIRDRLGQAVWVALAGLAARPGTGTLTLRVRTLGPESEEVRALFAVHVADGPRVGTVGAHEAPQALRLVFRGPEAVEPWRRAVRRAVASWGDRGAVPEDGGAFPPSLVWQPRRGPADGRGAWCGVVGAGLARRAWPMVLVAGGLPDPEYAWRSIGKEADESSTHALPWLPSPLAVWAHVTRDLEAQPLPETLGTEPISAESYDVRPASAPAIVTHRD